MRSRVVACAALVAALLAGAAHADPIHNQSPMTCRTDGGTDLRLPPGYHVDEPGWDALDLEVRRLQDAETRLTAERDSYRKSANSWRPGWLVAGAALVAGTILGAWRY